MTPPLTPDHLAELRRQPRTLTEASRRLLADFADAEASETSKVRKRTLLTAWTVVERALPLIEAEAAAEAARREARVRTALWRIRNIAGPRVAFTDANLAAIYDEADAALQEAP